MGLWKSLAGLLFVEIISAAPANMLTSVNNLGITLLDITYADDLRVRGKIYRNDYHKLSDFLQRRGEKVQILERSGLYWTAANLLKRPVLLTGLLVFFILALYLPTRVFFVSVEGNLNVPAQLIVEKAAECGINFGASRREVRSEKMKNALLSAIPQLQWAGVNTSGCTAVISVRERSTVDVNQEVHGVSSIVASRDGIIQEMTVMRGNALCKVGQAVREGQTLVSGYTDCGLSVKAERAEAEIMAQTLRDLQAVTPVSYQKRGEFCTKERRYYLRIGKNIINFCKDSGISDTTCVKMYTEKILTLPGGFELPISLITEHRISYEYEATAAENPDDFAWMKNLSETYLRTQMLAGSILNCDVNSEMETSLYRQSGKYTCLEMIGQVRNEEIMNSNGTG